MYDMEDYDFCQPYLVNGESILWTGKPEKGVFFFRQDLLLLPFGLIWLSFSLLWEFLAFQSGGSWIFLLWGLPFIAIGVYLVFGRFLQELYLQGKIFYVVTNKKILIKRGRSIRLYDGKDLPPMDVEIHRNGNGTILFCEEVYTRRGRRHRTYFALENLADVAEAQNAISSMDGRD